MSKITIVNKDEPVSTVSSINIKVGTVFSGTIGINSSIFLSAFGHQERLVPYIVDLQNPAYLWDQEVEVFDYRELDITITISRCSVNDSKGKANE